MMNMNEMTAELVAMMIDEKICSKVTTKENYLIATGVWNGELGIRYAGPKGKAGYGINSCWLRDLVARQYRWFYFTYKKDYEEALETLKAAGARENAWW